MRWFMHSFLPPGILSQAMDPSNRSQSWYVDPDQLKGALTQYPTLQAAVFPPPTTQLTPADSQDVTLYELLKVGVVLVCVTCCGWRDIRSLVISILLFSELV